MRTMLDELVGSIVARHLEISPASISPSTDLERDLHLDPRCGGANRVRVKPQGLAHAVN